MIMKILGVGVACVLLSPPVAGASEDKTEKSTPATPRVRTSQVPMYGSSLNKLPNDEQCRNLLERAKAVPALQETRDVRYCQSRLQAGGK